MGIMIHFDSDDAVEYGTATAIVLQEVRQCRDGGGGTSSASIKYLKVRLPFFEPMHIINCLNELLENGEIKADYSMVDAK